MGGWSEGDAGDEVREEGLEAGQVPSGLGGEHGEEGQQNVE